MSKRGNKGEVYSYRLSAREGTENVMSDACQWALLGYVRFIKVKFKGYRFQQRGDSYWVLSDWLRERLQANAHAINWCVFFVVFCMTSNE